MTPLFCHPKPRFFLSLRATKGSVAIPPFHSSVTATLLFLSLRGFEEAVAIPPLPIEEVRVPSSTLHPKDIKDEIASVAKNTTSQ